jgi:hypothetical protein
LPATIQQQNITTATPSLCYAVLATQGTLSYAVLITKGNGLFSNNLKQGAVTSEKTKK